MTTTALAVKVAAPRTTRVASLVVIVGVLAQAAIAGVSSQEVAIPTSTC